LNDNCIFKDHRLEEKNTARISGFWHSWKTCQTHRTKNKLLWHELNGNVGTSIWRNQRLNSLTFDSLRAGDIAQSTSSFLLINLHFTREFIPILEKLTVKKKQLKTSFS